MSDEGYVTRYQWVDLEEISEDMVKAAIVSEDSRFLRHKGFDIEEIKTMLHAHMVKGARLRGCSTISMQMARNCFTFCTPTLARKLAEAYFTVLIETIWGKERIVEVYLNVCELGRGVYGCQAASNVYFGIGASELSVDQAASLVCCLPSPMHRNPEWVTRNMSTRWTEIANSAKHFELPGGISAHRDTGNYDRSFYSYEQ